MKKLLFRLILAGLVAGAAWYGYRYFQSLPQRQQQVATTRVRRGEVTVRSFSRGELRAVRSVTLAAPNLFGTVQVTQLAPLGAMAREKDLVVEFDDSELLSRLEESQLELDQVEEQIKKARADQAIRDNQDEVELLRTRYSVRRSELEVKRNELLSAIDAKKNLLNLEESRRRLKQLESDIKSRREQSEAELAVLNERKNKAVLELNRWRQRLQQVKLLSPITGLVAIRQNRSSSFFVPGMQIPDVREGDQVQPGIPVADVLDLSELEVVSRVGELDRANLQEGQDVLMRLDAIPGARLTGTIKSMSGTASSNVFSNDPAKKFDVVFSVDMRQLLSALGASPAQIEKILATAEANRKKPVAMSSFTFGGGGTAGGPGGPGGMSMTSGPGGMGQGEGGPRMLTFGGGPGGAGGAGGPGGMGGMSEEQRNKMREVFRKLSSGKSPQDMTPEERTEFQKKLQAELAKAGINLPAGMVMGMGGGGGRRQGGEGRGGGEAFAGGGAGGRERGERGGGGRGGGGGDTAQNMGFPAGFGMGAAQQFSQKELDSAKLPPPPEEDSQLDVLLRPGMLADVEIIVEKISNAIHVPNQAIFEQDNKWFVYLKAGQKFEQRFVTISRRTESTVVLGSGVQPGDIVAMADPYAKPGDRKKQESKGSASSALPVGGTK
ncbi:MAG: efflux RND transporter periplasmic adaptor subunit [Acidobacteria bacterium]|nr:efflux RND transporter periplasmic adaptor subunit [Acidobacteriota bacterium]